LVVQGIDSDVPRTAEVPGAETIRKENDANTADIPSLEKTYADLLKRRIAQLRVQLGDENTNGSNKSETAKRQVISNKTNGDNNVRTGHQSSQSNHRFPFTFEIS
jgi:hypothetical protein